MIGALLLVAFASGLRVEDCSAAAGQRAARFDGTVLADQRYEHPFGRFVLRLEPGEFGWKIVVAEPGRDENLASLTPPWHFVPNPTDLEGWHFRNRDNTGPNDGSVNAPRTVRDFIFSPEVGRSLLYLGSATPPSVVDSVAAFGHGELRVRDYKLTPPDKGSRAAFVHLRFHACLVWRA